MCRGISDLPRQVNLFIETRLFSFCYEKRKEALIEISVCLIAVTGSLSILRQYKAPNLGWIKLCIAA